MGGGHARRQVRKERRGLGGNAELGVGALHGLDVLGARLLHDRQADQQRRRDMLDRFRHDLGHHARALAAAENQQPQFSAYVRRGVGRAAAAITSARIGLPVKDNLSLPARIELCERAKAGGDFGDARRPATGWRGP